MGGRSHVWDKATGDWRLDDGGRVVLLNVNTRLGRVFEQGIELADAARSTEALERAYEI